MKLKELGKLLVTRDGKATKRLLRMGEAELEALLREYLEHERQRDPPKNDFQNLVSYRSSLSTSENSASFLASALAYKTVYFNDPVAALVRDNSNVRFGETCIDRLQLARRVHFMRKLRPLISEGVLVPLPMSSYHWRSDIPMYYSEDRFRSALPDAVWKLAHEKAQVQPGEMAGDSIVIYAKAVEQPVLVISVAFQNDTHPTGMLFRLADMKFESANGKSVAFEASFDKAVPSKAAFDQWVDQSINRAMLNKLGDIAIELQQCEKLGAFYCTESAFESELLSIANQNDSPKPAANSTNFLLANRKAIRIDDPKAVLNFRTLSQSRIDDFQASLLAMSRMLADAQDFESAARREFDKTVRPQIEALEAAWGKLKGQVRGDFLLTVAGLTTMCNTGFSLPLAVTLASMGGVAKSFPTICEFAAKRQGLAFLWHSLT